MSRRAATPSPPTTNPAATSPETGPLPPPAEDVITPQPREVDTASAVAWRRIAEIRRLRAALVKEEAELKGQLRMRLGRGVFSIAGRTAFTIRENLRWNEDLARRVLPANVLELIEVRALSARKAKKVLSPQWYQRCRAPVGEDAVLAAGEHDEDTEPAEEGSE